MSQDIIKANQARPWIWHSKWRSHSMNVMQWLICTHLHVVCLKLIRYVHHPFCLHPTSHISTIICCCYPIICAKNLVPHLKIIRKLFICYGFKIHSWVLSYYHLPRSCATHCELHACLFTIGSASCNFQISPHNTLWIHKYIEYL